MKDKVATLLRKSARLWGDIDDGFRERALKSAAHIIERMAPAAFESRLENESLIKTPGIGEGVVNRVLEIIETGELAEIPGLIEERESLRRSQEEHIPQESPAKAGPEDYATIDKYECPF